MILYFQKLSLKARLVGVLLGFFLVFCFFYAFNDTPWVLVQLKQFSPDHGLPDQQFWYTPPELHVILGAWGVVGRDFYRTVIFPLDMAFPFFYTGFFLISVLYLLKKINPRVVWFYLLPLLPFGGGLCDLLENLCVFSLTWMYPDRWDALSWLGATMTAGKWVFLGVNLLLLAVLVVWHWSQRLKLLLSARP